jgi:hypothetical protein
LLVLFYECRYLRFTGGDLVGGVRATGTAERVLIVAVSESSELSPKKEVDTLYNQYIYLFDEYT